MMKLIEWSDDRERVCGEFATADEIYAYLDKVEGFLGSDNYGEDGYEVELPDGTRVTSL